MEEYIVDIQIRDGKNVIPFEFPFTGKRLDAINFAINQEGCAGCISNGRDYYFYRDGFLDNANSLWLKANVEKPFDRFK
jgi:hypothetical protein